MNRKLMGVISLFAFAGNVLAQGQNDEGIRLEELVVTASKKSESVLTSPVAVTAVTNEEIRTAGVVGLQDLNGVVPSLQVRETGSFGAITFAIRGVSNSDIFELANSPIATYIDGVYVGRPDAMGGIVHDISQIEVLRGPQGTLYGRNSTGGNVNIVSAKPVDDFEGSVDFSMGNNNEFQTRAMVNVPASDTLAVRGAFALRKGDGHYDSLGTTTRNYGETDETSLRLSALWQPSDNFEWHMIYESYLAGGTPGRELLTGPDGRPADGLPVFERPVDNSQEPDLDVDSKMIRSRMDWSVTDSTTVSYIFGDQNFQLRPQAFQGRFASYRDTPTTITSHEINISYDSERFQNILGASYFDQNWGANANLTAPQFDLVIWVHGSIDTQAQGIFNQSTFNVTDSLRLIAGIRHTKEDLSITGSTNAFCPFSSYPLDEFPLRDVLFQDAEIVANDPDSCSLIGAVAGSRSGGSETSKTTWKAGVAYDISNNSSTYASISTGFKAAGLNLGNAGFAQPSYGPEEVTSYEVGYKTRMLDNRLSLNTAVYFVDYNDIQVTQLRASPEGDLANVTTNAAGAENYGVELEWSWDVSDKSRFNGFFNYVNASYTDYTNAIDELTNEIIPSLNGNSLPYAPEYSVQLQYEYDFDLPNGGTLTPKISAYWQSESFIRAFNQPIDRIEGYSKTDLALTYRDSSDQWKIETYVHNLKDDIVRNGGYSIAGDFLSSYSAPRTFGARVTFNY